MDNIITTAEQHKRILLWGLLGIGIALMVFALTPQHKNIVERKFEQEMYKRYTQDNLVHHYVKFYGKWVYCIRTFGDSTFEFSDDKANFYFGAPIGGISAVSDIPVANE